MTDLYTKPHSSLALLVELSWSASTVRYTSWDNDLTYLGNLFVSEPSVEISSEDQDGGVKDNAFQLSIRPVSPFHLMSKGFPHARVLVKIYECDPEDIADTCRLVFQGHITKVVSNSSGSRGFVKARIEGYRRMFLGMQVGMPALTTCLWTFGDHNCCKDLEPLKETGTITAISGSVITLSGLTTTSAGYWRHGWAKYDGLTIDVMDHVTGSDIKLLRTPPPNWSSAVIEMVPGCDKSIAACRRWENEQRFGAFGIKIPAYPPNFFEAEEAKDD